MSKFTNLLHGTYDKYQHPSKFKRILMSFRIYLKGLFY